MAQATNSTLGEVKLAGDLAGNNNALAPELTATSVTPGSYSIPTLTVDAKGRVTSASNTTVGQVTALIPHASDTVFGTVKIGANISFLSTAGGLIVDFNGVLTGASATGLPNFAGCITVDVTQTINTQTVTRSVSISGANSQTITTLISEFNSKASAAGLSITLSLASGNLTIVTPAGAGNTLTIANDNLFTHCTGYVQVLANFTGTGDGTIWIPLATNSTFGVVKAGTGITNTNGVFSWSGSAPLATDITPGTVKVVAGNGLNYAANVLSFTPQAIPDATASVAGIGKIGTGLQDDGAGTVSLVSPLPDGTGSSKGVLGVTVGNGLTVTAGQIAMAASAVSTATATTLGIVKVPTAGNLVVDGAGALSVPVATGSVKGVISVTTGNGLLNTAGVLSINPAQFPAATGMAAGAVTVGGNINVSAGVISVDTATDILVGLFRVPTANGLSVSVGSVVMDLANSTTTYGTVKSANASNIVITSGAIDVGANIAKLDTANAYTKAQTVALVTLTDAATIAVNLSLGNVFKVTLAGNRTFGVPTNPVSGGQYTFIMTQDATGSRVITWPGTFKFRTGQSSVLSTTANKVDIVSAIYIAGTYYCDLVKGF